MISSNIKFFFIFFNYFLINRFVQHRRRYFSSEYFLVALFSVFLSLIAYLCNNIAPALTLLIPLLILFITNCIYTSSPEFSFSFTIVCIALSYSLFLIICLILTIIIAPLYYAQDFTLHSIVYILAGFLQIYIVLSMHKNKRLSRGMSYIYTKSVINIGTTIGILFILIVIFVHLNRTPPLYIQIAIVIFIPTSLFLLLHWWQSQLTKAYRKRLAQMELESLRTELEQKSILLKKLEAQNEEMGRLIHKDNKLIPAMEHAVSTYLTSDFTDLALQQAQGEALLTDLKGLSAARQGILSTFTPAATPKYETGIPSLDAILVYMYQKAQSNGIRFYATATQESLAKCPTKLTNEKLVHILSDLLENAIIATKSSSDKQIQLQIYLANGIFTIEIADTGLSFEPATLISFGLEKASTHLKDGGSGIGLLDIWKIKEEVKASIHIHEYETGTPFSKKIFISFDNRNKYVIHTWRDKELAPLVNRGDLVLLSQNQQTA